VTVSLRQIAITILLVLFLGRPAPAQAHAELLRANPEPNASVDEAPVHVELYFSEALEHAFSSITVLDANGQPVDNGDSRVDASDLTRMTVSLRSLPDGIYTISWKALSAVDGHLTSGTYPFAVGDVDAAALAAAERSGRQVRLSLGEVLARWMVYLSAAMLFGGTLFVLAVWQPAAASQADSEASLAFRPPWQRLAAAALACFLTGSIVGLLVQGGQATGAELAWPWSGPVGELLAHTRYGALWLARLALVLGLAAILLADHTRRRLGLALTLSLLLLFTISLSSHAAADSQPALPVLGDFLHLIGASVWIGGLTHFAAVLGTIRRVPGAGSNGAPSLAASMLPRFSMLALGSVGLLAMTGIYMAVLRLGSLEALAGTLYGRSLVVKTVLVLPMLGLGALNLLWVTPRIKRAVSISGKGGNLFERFRRSVTAEVGLGLAVVFMVALLTAMPPPRITAALPEMRSSARVDDLELELTISPARVGINTFALRVTSAGRAVTGAQDVLLRFTPTEANLAPAESRLEESEPGRYSIRGAYLSLPDTWQVQAVVRRPGEFDAYANFDVPLSAAGTAARFPWHRVTGAVLLVCAVLLAAAASQLAVPGRQHRAKAALAPAVAVFVAGAFVFYTPPAGAPIGLVNPIAPNQESIAIGRALYEANCLPCHGPAGRGDGPVGLTLNPRPADLSLHVVPGVHSDGQLFEWITYGFEGSVMPAFQGVLTDDQRWHLVNYIRTLAPQ
jgi:copper transport protein